MTILMGENGEWESGGNGGEVERGSILKSVSR